MNTPKRAPALLAIGAAAIVALAVSGCAPGAAANGQVVNIDRIELAKSYRFEPAASQVPLGTTVTWHNGDNFTHDVRLLGADAWQSEPLAPGKSASHTFSRPGEYAYECSFHPQNMKGKVIVTAP